MNLEIKPFEITMRLQLKDYRMQITQTYLSEQIEVFTVRGGKKEIKIQSDRPFWRNKGLNKHKIKWQVIEGQVNYMSAFEFVIKEIESVIKFIENPPFDWKNHPKNNPY